MGEEGREGKEAEGKKGGKERTMTEVILRPTIIRDEIHRIILRDVFRMLIREFYNIHPPTYISVSKASSFKMK